MEVSKNVARELATLRNEQNRSAIEHFGLSKKKPTVKARDTYTKSSECEEYLNYTKKDITETDIVVFKGELPREFINLINGDGEKPIILKGHKNNTVYEYNGVFFSQKNLPKIPDSELEEVRAVNNVIDFGKGNYFTYKGYRLYSNKTGYIADIWTEHLFTGHYGTEFYRFADFWNWCMDDVTYLGLPGIGYTRAETEYYLEEMGVDSDAGFVTIKMGEKENTLFHTKGKWFGALVNKDRYDNKYELMQSSKFGEDFGVGAVIKIGGKDYVFDENCQIKIPYGADIFDVEYPPVLYNL